MPDLSWKEKIALARKTDTTSEPTQSESTESPTVKEEQPKSESKYLGKRVKLVAGDSKQVDESLNTPHPNNPELEDAVSIAALTRQVAYLANALSNIYEDPEGPRLTEPSGKLVDKLSTRKPKKKAGPEELSGNEALLATYAKTHGIRRVYLLNSGFYVVMRAMTMEELHVFYSSVDLTSKEYGRILGGFFYLMEDLFIKQSFIDLLPSIIVDSNLINWNRPDVLLQHISIHDYDTLVWAASSLLHQEGVEVDLVCANPECRHIDTNVNIDINKLRYNLMDVIPEEAVSILLSTDKLVFSKLEEYQQLIRPTETTFKASTNNFYFKVPTLAEYIKYGNNLIAGIASRVRAKLDISNQNVLAAVMLNIYRMLTPWIEKVAMLDDDGNVEYWIKEAKAIDYMLDISEVDNDQLIERLTKYTTDTKLTYICYTGMECPVCHTKPGNSVNDYYPVDIQYFFFSQCCLKLELTNLF